MTAEQPVLQSASRRPRWRYSCSCLRSLLLFMTAAASPAGGSCNSNPEEQFGTTPLRLRRQSG